jgi:hypothetical protein
MLYTTGRSLLQPLGGYLAVTIMLGVPLLAVNVKGAGLDLLNLLMILAAANLAYRYVIRRDELSLNAMLLTVVLLMQTRYESALFALAAGLIILQTWRIGHFQITKTTIITPLLSVPIPLLQSIFNAYPQFWQLEDKQASEAFALAHVPSNLEHAAEFFFGAWNRQPSSFFLTVMFFCALLVALFYLFRKKAELQPSLERLVVVAAFGGVVLVNFALLMAYHWGQISDIIASRLVLPFLLFQVIFGLIVLQVVRADQMLQRAVLVLSAFYFILVARPLCANGDFLHHARGISEVNYLYEKMDQHEGDPALFITNRHVAGLARQTSAISVGDALRHLPELELHQSLKTFDPILLLCLVPIGDTTQFDEVKRNALLRHQDIKSAFDLNFVEARKLDDDYEIYYYEVQSVNVAKDERLNIHGVVKSNGEFDPELMESFSKSLP